MRVVSVPSKRIKGFYGMNHEAGKKLGVKCPRNIILVDSSLKGRMRVRTIQHEKVEEYNMRVKHMSYKKADGIAMSFENQHKRRKK